MRVRKYFIFNYLYEYSGGEGDRHYRVFCGFVWSLTTYISY